VSSRKPNRVARKTLRISLSRKRLVARPVGRATASIRSRESQSGRHLGPDLIRRPAASLARLSVHESIFDQRFLLSDILSVFLATRLGFLLLTYFGLALMRDPALWA